MGQVVVVVLGQVVVVLGFPEPLGQVVVVALREVVVVVRLAF